MLCFFSPFNIHVLSIYWVLDTVLESKPTKAWSLYSRNWVLVEETSKFIQNYNKYYMSKAFPDIILLQVSLYLFAHSFSISFLCWLLLFCLSWNFCSKLLVYFHPASLFTFTCSLSACFHRCLLTDEFKMTFSWSPSSFHRWCRVSSNMLYRSMPSFVECCHPSWFHPS